MEKKLTVEEIMVETGLSYEEAKNSWAIKNPKEARELMRFFGEFIETVRGIIKS